MKDSNGITKFSKLTEFSGKGKSFLFSYRLVTLDSSMFPISRLCAISISFAMLILVETTACSDSHPTYPWNLKDRSIPSFQVLSTDNPITDEYTVTYCVKVRADKNSSRDDIKVMSAKIIEGLPNHNIAVICFIGDPSEKDKDWTVARTWWGPKTLAPSENNFPFSGDYSRNEMMIAMKGDPLPGAVVESY